MQLDPLYVKDEITWNEVNLLLEELESKHRDSWEQTRLIMWSVFQSQSSKQLKVKDVLPLSWDEKSEDSNESTGITKEEIEEFKRINNIK